MTTTLADPVTATHVEGPGLVSWLECHGLVEKGGTPEFFSERERVLLSSWRNGGDGEILYVDQLLIRLDVRLEELPPQLFLRKKPQPAGIPDEKRDRILKLHKLGSWNLKEIAAMVGVHPETVRNHVRKVAA